VYYTDDFTGSSVGAEMVEGNAFTPNATGSLVEINDIYTGLFVIILLLVLATLVSCARVH
jgi:hypothetical protein